MSEGKEVPILSILVVDDHDFARLGLKFLLEAHGHNILTAGDGQEALAQFDANHVDLLITDLQMPVMDGIELTSKVRQRFPATFIIAISADTVLGIEALDAGAHLFLAKPFPSDNLVGAIAELFGSSHA